jgi:hypothetical protein
MKLQMQIKVTRMHSFVTGSSIMLRDETVYSVNVEQSQTESPIIEVPPQKRRREDGRPARFSLYPLSDNKVLLNVLQRLLHWIRRKVTSRSLVMM